MIKMLTVLEIMLYLGRGLRYFHAGNIGSVGQRASKLLAVKYGIVKKSLPAF